MLDKNSVNKVILVGNLGSDPEVRDVNGQQVANFSLATNESWTDKSGQRQERTQWHRITVWGKQAEFCGRYLSKGRKVFVEGRIGYRDVEKDGVTTRYTDITAQQIQALDSKGNTNQVDYDNNDPGGYAPSSSASNQSSNRSQSNNRSQSSNPPSNNPPMPPPPDDEDIPF